MQVRIDAAIVAQHQVCVRATDANGRVSTHRFRVQPALAGLTSLGKQLPAYPGAVAVAEPTSMTWLGLSIAATETGGQFALLGSRHASRLRGAISGKNKTDVIDADVLARAGEVFELTPLRLPSPAELALRRLCVRRGSAVTDANRYLRRLLSLARWAFPDVWNAFQTSLPTARAVLGRWPHLAQLACARRAALTAVVAEHTRGAADVPEQVEAIPQQRRRVGHVLDRPTRPGRAGVRRHRAPDRPDHGRATRRPGHRTGPPVLGTSLQRRSAAELDPRRRTGHRPNHPRLPRRRQPARLGQGRRQLRRHHPVELVLRHSHATQPGHHQPRTARAAACVLPGRQRRPQPGPPAGRVLLPANGPSWTHPHPGLRRRRPQARRTHLDRAPPRPAAALAVASPRL